MLTEPVPPHLDINWFITKTYPTLSHAYAYLKNFHLKCMTFIWEIKKIIKKGIFPLNNQCPLVSCFLHTSHLLWPYIASYPWLLRVIPTRNVQDKTFEQHSNCKGLEKAIPLLLPRAVSITDFYSVTLPIPVHVQSGTAAEMWDEELTWEFLFPYPAHYLQQSKGFIVLFLSLLFNMHAAQGILKERRVAGETEISPWAFPDP